MPDPASQRHTLRISCALALLTLCVPGAAHAAPPPFAAPFLSYPLPFGPTADEVADVDADGHPDLLVSRHGGVEVLLGSADGTFTPGPTAPGGVAAQFTDVLAVGDLDGDGDADLVMGRDSVSVGVALGDGSGHFAALVSYAVSKAPVALVLGDFDGDTVPDLASVSSRADNVSILLGVGDGTFGPPSTVATGLRPVSIAAADIDLDGDLDLLVGNQTDRTLSRLLGDGAGQFTPTAVVPLPGTPSRIVIGQLDAGVLPDIAVGSLSTPAVFVLAGTGGGGFAPAQSVPVPDIVTDLAVGDLDRDGVADLVATIYYLNLFAVRRGLGGMTFGPVATYTTERAPVAITLADVNGGGKLDAVALGSFSSVSVHMGNGDGTFGGRDGVPVGSQPWTVAAGDLDADGRADVVTANIGTSTLSVARGRGDGTFDPPGSLAAGTEPRGVTIADLDGDGHLDLVVANHGPGTQSFSTVSTFLGDGVLGFGPRADIPVGRWSEQVAVGDLNGDGHADLAVATDDFNSTLTVLDGLGDGSFTNRRDFSIGSNATGVALGDVTRDGRPDIVLAAYTSNSAFVVPGQANGTFGAPIQLATPGNTRGVAIGDVDADGFPDVVAGHGGVTVFRSLPGGSFAAGLTTAAGGGPLVVADLDGDGRADAVTANDSPNNSLSVLFAQPSGALGARGDLGAGDRPFAVVATDVDGDSRADLLTADLGSSTVSVLINTGGIAWLPWLGAPPPVPIRATFTVYPNPATGPLVFRLELPRTAPVRLRLYDVAGRVLATLANGTYGPGVHRIEWAPASGAGGVRAGVCFAEWLMAGERRVRRIVLMH